MFMRIAIGIHGEDLKARCGVIETWGGEGGVWRWCKFPIMRVGIIVASGVEVVRTVQRRASSTGCRKGRASVRHQLWGLERTTRAHMDKERSRRCGVEGSVTA